MLDLTTRKTAIDRVMYSITSLIPNVVEPPNIVESSRTANQCHRKTHAVPMVRAGTSLKMNSMTEIIDISRFSRESAADISEVSIKEENGRLYSISKIDTACWIKKTPFAEDCHSCNVSLIPTEGGVYLKTLRAVKRGEPLLMWFAQRILAIINMPFLKPIEIVIGQGYYKCCRCHKIFSAPNHLKIHILLRCGQLGVNHLWKTLERNFHINTISTFICNLPTIDYGSLATITPSSTCSSPPLPISMSSTAKMQFPALGYIIPTLENRNRRCSAFQPYINHSSSMIHDKAIADDSFMTSDAMQRSQSIRSEAQAAEMETFVSNLGKSKEGHVCFYCGKAYSRKYGLKIHIRTHTGYKPLRCKYCSRAFGDPSNLNKHVRLHNDSTTPYKCLLCDKILVRKRDLDRHMKSRHQNSDTNHPQDYSDGECIELN